MASSAPNALNTRAQPQPIDRLFAMPTMRPRFPCSRGALATGMGMRVASLWVRPSRRRATQTSTTLADLLTLPLVANPFSTVRATLRRRSSEEFEDGVAYGWQSWLRRRPVDSFFPALLL